MDKSIKDKQENILFDEAEQVFLFFMCMWLLCFIVSKKEKVHDKH